MATEKTDTPPADTPSDAAPTVPGFADLGLASPVLRAVDEVGYEAPSSIQAEAIPPLLERRDLLGQAQTGTGKTAAFALPILSLLDLSVRRPQALVLTPTRELAIQVAEAMQTYARYLSGFHVVPVYGGQSIDVQLRKLRHGVHVVVGTPGRIQDHLRRKTLKLDALHTVVLDEADEMLRMGFADEVEAILEHTPEEKQVALFSATLPKAIRKIAEKYLRDPVSITIETKTATVTTVTQRYWRVTGVNKLDALTRILEVEDFDAMLVFVRTKVATAELAEKLEARGFACSALNGDMNQSLRERTVDRLKAGKLDIVVATDVAARGLDVDRISHVVNYDIPWDVEAYVHRIGRTARAGRKGVAILFVSPRERRMLHTIERVTRQTIEPMQLPSREDVAERRVRQFKESISEVMEAEDLGFFEDLVGDYARENDFDPMRVAAALALMAQRERPLRKAPGSSRPERQTERQPDWKTERRPERSGDTQERRERDEKPRHPQDDGVTMERYRVEVGREHGVLPGNLVGAIAKEGDLDGEHIGRIKIFDKFSLVELPEGMPHETYAHLREVWVCGQKLRLQLDDRRPARETWEKRPAPGKDRKHGKPPGKAHGKPPGKRPPTDRPPRKDDGKDERPRPDKKKKKVKKHLKRLGKKRKKPGFLPGSGDS